MNDSPGRQPLRLPLRPLLLLAGLVACLRYLFAEIARLHGGLGFPLDDSWIHLQFARNLAAGAGLSYNPGALVTGSTAPLWTALLAVLFPLPGSVIVWTKLLGAALYLAGGYPPRPGGPSHITLQRPVSSAGGARGHLPRPSSPV